MRPSRKRAGWPPTSGAGGEGVKIDKERLEALQRQAGLSGQALAARAGITPPMLSRLKSRGSCSKTTAKKLAAVLGYGFTAQERPTVKPYALPTLEECQAAYQREAPVITPYEAARDKREAENTRQTIMEFLDRPVPVGWERWPLKNRLLYWRGSGSTTVTDYGLLRPSATLKSRIPVAPRDRVCAAEVWAEAFRHPPEDLTNKATRNINQIISTLPGWKKAEKGLRFGPHGFCRGFVRAV